MAQNIVEVMARGIWDEPGPDGDAIAVYFTDNFRSDGATTEECHKWAFMAATMAAAGALAALEGAGYVVVPAIATDAMLEAGLDYDEKEIELRIGRPPTVEECQQGEWSAMLAAYKHPAADTAGPTRPEGKE